MPLPNAFVRARPGTIILEEQYKYHYEIARTLAAPKAVELEGAVKVIVPYDGHQTFTRAAISDTSIVERNQVNARIGILHLLRKPQPGKVSLHWPSVEVIPLEIPLSVARQAAKEDNWTADKKAAQISVSLGLEKPDICPLNVDAFVFDEDQVRYNRTVASFLPADISGQKTAPQIPPSVPKTGLLETLSSWLGSLFQSTRSRSDSVTEVKATESEDVARQQLAELGTFENGLALSFAIDVFWPAHLAEDVALARLHSARLHWPLSALEPSDQTMHLYAGDERNTKLNWRYEEGRRIIEWDGLEAENKGKEEGTNLVHFAFPKMYLVIDSVLDLSHESSLSLSFEIEVIGSALSGRSLLIFDAIGNQLTQSRFRAQSSPQLHLKRAYKSNVSIWNELWRYGRELWAWWLPNAFETDQTSTVTQVRTRLIGDATLWLAEAFARRQYLPRRRMIFEGIRLDEERLHDIRQVLRDLGFEIRDEKKLEGTNLGYVFRAKAKPQLAELEGHSLELMLVAYAVDVAETKRELQIEGGVKLITPITTANLELLLLGAVKEKDDLLQSKFNQLCQLLRIRFANVVALR